MYCVKCGEKLEEDYLFCPICGTKRYEQEHNPSQHHPSSTRVFQTEGKRSPNQANEILSTLLHIFGKLKNVNKYISFTIYFFLFFIFAAIDFDTALPLLILSIIGNCFFIVSYGFDKNIKIQVNLVVFVALLTSFYIVDNTIDKLFKPGAVFFSWLPIAIFCSLVNLGIYTVLEKQFKKVLLK